MHGKKLFALLLAALFALSVAPISALGYDVEERFLLNQWTTYTIWEPPTEGSTCTCDYKNLPKGMAWYYEYSYSAGKYVYLIKGTPTQVGKYDVRFDFYPEGGQTSSIVIRFIVTPGNNYFHFLQDEYKVSGTVGEYLWYRFPHAFGAAQQWEFGEYYNPGEQNYEITGIGLKVIPEGTLCGTPTKAGTFVFWIYSDMYYDGDWYEDYAKVTVTISNAATPTAAPTTAPTAAPTSAPTVQPSSAAELTAPDFVMEAPFDLLVKPNERFEITLLSTAGTCTVGNLIETAYELPDSVSLDRISGAYVLRGVMTEQDLSGEGLFYEDGEPFNGLYSFYLILTHDGINYILRYRLREDVGEDRVLYPEPAPMSGFGE